MIRISHSTVSNPPVLDGWAAWKCYLSLFSDPLGTLDDLYRHRGALVALRAKLPFRKRLPNGFVVAQGDLNRQILSDPETYRSGGVVIRGPRGSAQNRLRKGLVAMNGEQHRETRRMVAPLFLPKTVRQYYPGMINRIDHQLRSWPVGHALDIRQAVNQLSITISAQNLLPGDDPAESARIAELTSLSLQRAFAPGVWMLPWNVTGSPYKRMLQGSKELEQLLLGVIDRRKPSSTESANLFDRLIALHQAEPSRMPRDKLVGQMVMMFAASYETIARVVMWALFLLSQHPPLASELYDELRERCGNAPPSLEDLDHLPLLDGVMQETMRLFPPLPFLVRRSRDEAELGGVPVRPRDFIICSIYTTHRDPEVFPQPLEFRPDRWFASHPDGYSFLPFGAGPHVCIAKMLGLATMKLITAMIVSRFRLTMVPQSRIDRTVQLTLGAKYGMPMTVERQDGRFKKVPVRGNVHEMVDLSCHDHSTRAIILRRSSGGESQSRPSFVRAA